MSRWSDRLAAMRARHEVSKSDAAINDLPDSAFAFIEPGGTKDEDGKTVPRSKRHFPIHDAAHVRNALARASSSPFGARALPKIKKAAEKFGIEVSKSEDDTEFRASGVISKADDERQIVYGWAYVTHDPQGNVVVDKSGDFIDEIDEIEKAAVQFMLTSRNTDADHTNVRSGSVVESMVFTPEKTRAMGIPDGVVPTGWWIGTKVDDATWADYKAGRLKAFSVHGKGVRKAVE